MKLEQQVCSLELAKKLKELGVKQSSVFWWTDEELVILPPDMKRDWKVTFHKDLYPEKAKYVSAFTVAELGEMLPYVVGVKKIKHTHEYFLQCGKLALGWHILYENGGNTLFATTGHTEAGARASMLTYLLENNLIHSLK